MLQTRAFDQEDQIQFARLTGDFNPMHLDPIAARRTLAGAPVVHGIHILLWLLDFIAADRALETIALLEVKFVRMLYVGETATATISRQDEASLRAKANVGDTDILHVTLFFGAPSRRIVRPHFSATLCPTIICAPNF